MDKWTKMAKAAKAATPENKCEAFLAGFLSGGPILRTNVYREVENAKLNWEEVKAAFHKLNGYEYTQKGDLFWRIMPD